MTTLTQKQESFCLAIIEGKNASDAYRHAYDAEAMKPATVNRKAKELMDNGKISARIKELRAPALASAQITQEYVLTMLQQNLERAMQHEEIKDTQGRGTGEYRYEGAVANKSIELMGKHLGMFTDKHDHKFAPGSAIPTILIMRDSADHDTAD